MPERSAPREEPNDPPLRAGTMTPPRGLQSPNLPAILAFAVRGKTDLAVRALLMTPLLFFDFVFLLRVVFLLFFLFGPFVVFLAVFLFVVFLFFLGPGFRLLFPVVFFLTVLLGATDRTFDVAVELVCVDIREDKTYAFVSNFCKQHKETKPMQYSQLLRHYLQGVKDHSFTTSSINLIKF